MMIDLVAYWPAFVLAIVLLFFPPSLMMGKRIRRALSHQREAGTFGIVAAVLAWQNWVDLARAFGGTWILMYHAVDAPEPELRSQAFLLQGAVLAAAMFFQTIRRYKGKMYYLAPVFFVWGTTAVLVNPVGAFYGIAIAVIVARIVNDVEWHLPVLAAATGATVYFLDGLSRGLIVACVLIILPVLITFLGKGKMVFVMRFGRTEGRE